MEPSKKIGIVTYHCVDNFGAVLQCYALQSVVTNISNLNVEVIDYRPNYNYKGFSFFSNPFNQKVTLLIRIKIILSNFDMIAKIGNIIRKFEFDKFRKKCIKLSKYIIHNDANLSFFSNYSIVITGSDQVFNPSIQRGRIDKVYFLDINFRNIKKIAYAASMGELPIESVIEKDVIKRIENIDNVSVRENSAFDYIKKLSDKEISVCLDPTLLLDMKDWESVSIHTEEKNYIFVYDLEFSMDVVKIVNTVSKLLNKKVICFSRKGKKHYNDYVRNFNSVGPSQFLSLINNADFVITNSFHGTVFAVIYKKKFISIKNGTRPGRAVDLLNLLHLQSRLIENTTDLKNIDLSKDVSYDKSFSILKEEQTKSINFLKHALESNK